MAGSLRAQPKDICGGGHKRRARDGCRPTT